jgi:hypothetical protein
MKKIVIEGITNYNEFTKEVFKQSLAIVENRNCSTYKLLGYKYLDVRLILNFHDCNEVYDFTFNGGVMEVESFYTKDIIEHEERLAAIITFEAEMSRDIPE